MQDRLEVPIIHTIEAGNYSTTLSALSLKYYSNENLWPVIAEKNGITGTTILKPGDKLMIPGIPRYWRYQAELIVSHDRNVFHAYSPFQGSDEKFAPFPVLIPPIPAGSQFAVGDLPVSIAQLCLNQDWADPQGFENDDFTFRWKPDPAKARKSSGPVAQITVKANHMWRMASAERTKFHENFQGLRSHVEDLELQGTVVRGGTGVVTQRVAAAIPGNFDETVFFRYGFNSGFGPQNSPYVDLQPGMRLRIGLSASEAANDPGLDGSLLTIGHDQDGRLVFDAFLGAISTPANPFAPALAAAGGLMDLHAAGNARRHVRLFYPSQRIDPVTLIGADTLTDLQAATQIYTTSGKINVPHVGERPVIAFTLPGGAVALPEIGVNIMFAAGAQITQPFQYVPLGKTVRQVVEDLVPAGNQRDFFTGGIRPARVHRQFTLTGGLPEYREILFDTTPELAIDYRIFDLPLAAGDRVRVNLPSH